MIASSGNMLTRGNLHAFQQRLVQERARQGKGIVHGHGSQRETLTDAALSLGITLSPRVMDELINKHNGRMPLERFMMETDKFGAFLVGDSLESATSSFVT
jgi:hypothetical protein